MADPSRRRLFLQSYERCIAQPDFLHDFYRDFIARSPRVAELFAHTDMARQVDVLRSSLFIMIHAQGNSILSTEHVEQLGRRHARLGVEPYLYDLWLEALLGAVQRYDPACSPEVEAAWREALGTGIERMKACEPDPDGEPPPHPVNLGSASEDFTSGPFLDDLTNPTQTEWSRTPPTRATRPSGPNRPTR